MLVNYKTYHVYWSTAYLWLWVFVLNAFLGTLHYRQIPASRSHEQPTAWHKNSADNVSHMGKSQFMLSGTDKVYHIFACYLITTVTFAILIAAVKIYKKFHNQFLREDENVAIDGAHVASTALPSCEIIGAPNYTTHGRESSKLDFCHTFPKSFYMIASGMVAITVGIVKEIGDIYNIWPLCNHVDEDGTLIGCQASWNDIFSDLIGVLLAEVSIFIVSWIRNMVCNTQSAHPWGVK